MTCSGLPQKCNVLLSDLDVSESPGMPVFHTLAEGAKILESSQGKLKMKFDNDKITTDV